MTIPKVGFIVSWNKYKDATGQIKSDDWGFVDMARYPALFTLGIKIGELHASLKKVLEACNLNMIYDTPEYVMAREIPGNVPFPKLVTVEVLIDRTTATADTVQLKLVVKNEELPLQVGNHCAQMFEVINTAINGAPDWTVKESFTGEEESR